MRKWIITGLIAAAFAALAATGRLWLPSVLEFSGTNKDSIQSLTSMGQVALVFVGVVVAIVGLRRNRAPVEKGSGPHAEADRSSVAVGGDAKGGIFTGDNPIVADKVEIYNAPVVTGVEALHQMPSPSQ